MLNIIFKKSISFVVICSLAFVSMLITLSPSRAEGNEEQEDISLSSVDDDIIYPKIRSFQKTADLENTVKFSVLLDKNLTVDNTTLYLYRQGESNPIDQTSSGTSIIFTAPKPTEDFYEYYVSVGPNQSSNITVFPYVNDGWNVSSTVDKTIYSTSDAVMPRISWNVDKTLNSNHYVYLVESETGNVIGATRTQSGSLPIKLFYDDHRTYEIYIGNYQNALKNVSGLRNFYAKSNEIKIEIESWNITGSVDAENYSTENQKLNFTWKINQKLGGSYGVYVIDVSTNKIILKTTGNADTGTFSLNPKYDNNVKKYQLALAPNGQTSTEKDDLNNIKAESNIVTTDHNDWEILLTSDNYSFYTDDSTPNLVIQTNQPRRIKNSGYMTTVYYKEIGENDATYSTYIPTDTDYFVSSHGIKRFYTEKSKQYQAFVYEKDENGNNQIVAESNIITIKRAPWEIYVDKTVNIDNNNNEAYINWRGNQLLHDGYNGHTRLYGTNFKYAMYIHDVETNQIYRHWISPGAVGKTISGSYKINPNKPGSKYRVILALDEDNLKFFSELRDIQAISDTITARPSQWNIAVKDAIEEPDPNNATRKIVRVNFESNKTLRNSGYALFMVNKDDGKVMYGPYNAVSKGIVSFYAPVDQNGIYLAYIAEHKTRTNSSQFEDIQAISSGRFPAELINDNYINYHTSERFAGGGNPSTADCQQQCYGDPVNSYNGELFENSNDLTIESVIPFGLTRSYSSIKKEVKGSFGYGWEHNFNMKLEGDLDSLIESQYISVTQENGSMVAFSKIEDENGNIEYITASSVKAELKYNNSTQTYLFERKDGNKFIFNNEGILNNIKDRNNNSLSLERNNDGQIIRIFDNQNKEINIEWNNNLITSANDNTHTVNYYYNESNELTKVEDSKIDNDKNYIYYSDHKIHKITHPNGGTYETFYDSKNRVVEQKDPKGNSTTFAYNDLTRTITLPDGTVNKDTYNSRGWLTVRTLALGTPNVVTYSYSHDSSGNVIYYTDPNKKVTRKNYDSYGNLMYSVDPLGRINRFTYNDQNLLTTITNPKGDIFTNIYDDNGNLVETIDYEGKPTKFNNDKDGKLISIQEPNQIPNNGPKITYHYSNRGLINKTVDTLGNESALNYDNKQNISEIIDPTGNITKIQYLNNNPNLPTKTIYPNGSEETIIYDGAGRVIKEIGTDGNNIEYTYDLMDNVLTIKTIYGTTSYAYDSHNRVISETSVKGSITNYEYNNLGMLTKTIYDDGSTATNTYTKHGLLATTTDAKGNTTTYTYDVVGNVLSVKDAVNSSVSYSYDVLNNITTSRTAQGNSYSYKYDKNGNMLSITDPDGNITKNSYDDNGNLITTTYPNGLLSVYTYNSENILVSNLDRFNGLKTYTYDENGNIVESKVNNSKTTNYSYDSMSNVIEIMYNNDKSVIYEYDNSGKITMSQSSDGEITNYAYDAIGNVTSRGPPGKEVQYSYTPYGEINKITYPSGKEVEYTYNSENQLTNVSSNNETIAEYSYDENFNNISTEYGNNILENNSFDVLNRLNSINVQNASSQSLYQRNLTFDKDSRILNSQSFFNGTKTIDKTYTYTKVDTIATVLNNTTKAKTTLTYDVFKNLTKSGSNTFNYESNYRLTSSKIAGSENSVSYDELGNRLTNNDSNIHRSYEWNIDGTLKNVNIDDQVDDNNDKNIDYSYENSGLLDSKTVDGQLVDEYVWDNVSSSIPLLLEDSKNEYIYGIRGSPIAQVDKDTDEIHYLHGDERNSVVLATDNNGNAVLTREYDEYGQILDEQYINAPGAVSDAPETDSDSNTPAVSDGGGDQAPIDDKPVKDFFTNFAYAGEYKDSDTGLYNLRARWYEPSTGTFLSVDPLFAMTNDAYGYASGNPLSNIDPLGLSAWNKFATGAAGVIDGAIGVPLAGSVMNRISPGSVDNCSLLYAGLGAAAGIGIMFVPGGGFVKAGGLLAKGGKSAYGFIKHRLKNLDFNDNGYISLGFLAKNVEKIQFKNGSIGIINKNGMSEFHLKKGSYDGVYDNHAEYFKAQGKGDSMILTKELADKIPKNRYHATKNTPTQKGLERDEFPYASTQEGGLGARIQMVLRKENNNHGNDLKQFYRKAGMKPGDQFIVRLK